MEKVYKSQIGLELAIPLIVLFTILLILMLIQENSWIGILILLPIILFFAYLFLSTYYTIEGDGLIVKSGFLVKETIAISTIYRVSETRNPISSPAMSMDRLEIKYNKFDSVIISPKLKNEFVEHLTSLNSNIEVIYRKK